MIHKNENESVIRACVPDGIVKTACELCAWGCGMEVHIKDGQLERVTGNRDHPFSEGFLCQKGLAVKDIVSSKERITYPMKKVNGDWHRITLQRLPDGTWRLVEARRAFRCYRGHQQESFGERLCL